MKRIFYVNPDKPLYKLWMFWLPLIFVLIALSVSYPTWCLCLPHPTEYETILKTQGLPIFIASLSIPLMVAVTRFHSSAQRAKSNQIAEQNNAFNNYFDHRRHFDEFMRVRLSQPHLSKYVILEDSGKIYDLLFPNNSYEVRNLDASSEEISILVKEKVKGLHGFLNGYVTEFQNYEDAEREAIKASDKNEINQNLELSHLKGASDPLKETEPKEFLRRMGGPFGLTLKLECVEEMAVKGSQKKGKAGALKVCFGLLIQVFNETSNFKGVNWGGWLPTLALDPNLSIRDASESFDKHLYKWLKDGLDKSD